MARFATPARNELAAAASERPRESEMGTILELKDSGPHFLGIGSSRCGTTTVYHALRSQPSVWLPPVKELHYWDDQRGTGRANSRVRGHVTWIPKTAKHVLRRDLHARRDAAFFARYVGRMPTDAWYAALFEPGRGLVTGEITPAYCTLDAATIADVVSLRPGIRAVLMLRDPVDRAWSAVAKSLARSRNVSTDDVPASAIRSHLSTPGFSARADYVRTLDLWSAALRPGHLFVGFLDDMISDPHGLATRLATFLGIPEGPVLAQRMTVAHNTTEGSRGRIPPQWERELCARFADLTGELVRRFPAGPPVAWRDRVERALR